MMLLTTEDMFTKSSDDKKNLPEMLLENARFFTRTEIGTDSGRQEPVPVQR